MDVSTSTSPNGHSPGLCLTCDNMATCVHREHRGYHAMYCDLFQVVPAEVVKPKSIEGSGGYREENVVGPSPRGLCADCENSVGCSLSTAEGGVWDCEDYR